MRDVAIYSAACAIAAVTPLLTQTGSSAQPASPSAWPTTFEDRLLQPLALTGREQRMTEGFPGHVARFTDGHREIIIRHVLQPTRRLHPASDCFRAGGYIVKPLPLWRDAEDRAWGQFEAIRAGERLIVRELVYDETGTCWSDASAWFWSSTLRRSTGPWWAITVCTRE